MQFSRSHSCTAMFSQLCVALTLIFCLCGTNAFAPILATNSRTMCYKNRITIDRQSQTRFSPSTNPIGVPHASAGSVARPSWESSKSAEDSQPRASNNWKWILAAFVAGLVRPYIGTWVAMAQTNYYWQTNLVKNVLTVAGAAFVVRSQISSDTIGWPAHLLATGVVAVGVQWLASVLPFPPYGINLFKHVFCMWAVVRAINFAKEMQQRRRLEAFRMEAAAVAIPVSTPENAEEIIEETSVDSVEDAAQELSEAAISASVVDDSPETETPILKKPSGRINTAVTGAVDGLLYTLSHLQDELAEIQLKKIPAVFSTDSYDKAQSKLTEIQSEAIPKLFSRKKAEDSEK